MVSNAKDLLNDPYLRDAPSIEGFKVLEPAVLYSRVGKGGMGTVYRGRHFSLECDVAIKVLKADLSQDRAFVARFEREARLAAQINHQNVVRVMDVKHRKGVHYLVMEFVKGETARERVARKGPLCEREALSILAGAATGLAEAHSKNIIHRDIKPDNILISAQGEVKLADLGLAKANASADNSLSMLASGIMGTPQYMPPEQWRTPDVKPSADVWALGALLYYLLVGRSAIPSGELLVMADCIRHNEFPLLSDARSDLSQEVVELCARCTRRDPAERFATARELMRHVRPMVAHDDCDEVLADSATGTGIVRAAMVTPPPRETLARIRLHVASEILGQEAAQTPVSVSSAMDPKDSATAIGSNPNETKVHTTPLPASGLPSGLPSGLSAPEPAGERAKMAVSAVSQRQWLAVGGCAMLLLLVIGVLSGWFGSGDPETSGDGSTEKAEGDPQSNATTGAADNSDKHVASGRSDESSSNGNPSTGEPNAAAANANPAGASELSESGVPTVTDPDAEAKALAAYERGMVALPKVGQLATAIKELEEAVRLDSKLKAARKNLVLAMSARSQQLESSNPGVAYASAMRVLELEPSDAAMIGASKRLRESLQQRLLGGFSLKSPAGGAVFLDPAVRVQGRMIAPEFAALRMSMDDRPNATSQPFLREDSQPVQVVAGTFATVLAPPGNGPVLLRIELEDANGVIAEAPAVRVIINTTAPVLTVAAPKDGAKVAASLRMRGTVKHPTKAMLRIQGEDVVVADDGTWEHTIALGGGDQLITIVARDEADRETKKELNVKVDRQPPQLQIEGELPAITKKAAVRLSGRVTDPGKATLKLDGKDVLLGKEGVFDIDLQMAKDGVHTFVLIASDAVGNEVRQSVEMRRDTTAPVLKWVAPPEAVAVGDFEVRGTVQDASPGPVVSVNGVPATMDGTNWRATVTVQDRQTLGIEVTARDALGNESTPLKSTLVGRASMVKLAWADPARDARAVAIGDIYYPSVVVEQRTGIRMVLVLPGEFQMGSPESEPGHEVDEAQHARQIRNAFYLGETEVTQAQWRAIMGTNPSSMKAEDHPVEGISWEECKRFLAKVNRVGAKFRLPSEAEWEYACRAGKSTPYHFGVTARDNDMCFGEHPFDIGNRQSEGTVAVGSLPPNAFGLHEMHGNVWEWCADTMKPYPRVGNETAMTGSGMRVVRGGSWRSPIEECRSANRQGCQDSMSLLGVGMRIAITL